MVSDKQGFRMAAGILALSATMIVLYYLILFLCERIWPSGIIFYSYMRLSVIFLAGFSLLGFILHRRAAGIFSGGSAVVASIIFLLFTYAFNITFPVNIERSFSVFMLGTLANYEDKMPESVLSDIVSDYFHGQKLVERRIREQLATGTIVVEDGYVVLTPKGHRIVTVMSAIGWAFNLDMSNANPPPQEERAP